RTQVCFKGKEDRPYILGRHSINNIAGWSGSINKIMGSPEGKREFYVREVYIVCIVIVDLLNYFFLVRPKQNIETFVGKHSSQGSSPTPCACNQNISCGSRHRREYNRNTVIWQ